jgi:hypothetical protein
LTVEEKTSLKGTFEDLATDTVRTPAAASRFRRLIAKVGPAAGNALLEIIVSVATDEAKTKLGLTVRSLSFLQLLPRTGNEHRSHPSSRILHYTNITCRPTFRNPNEPMRHIIVTNPANSKCSSLRLTRAWQLIPTSTRASGRRLRRWVDRQAEREHRREWLIRIVVAALFSVWLLDILLSDLDLHGRPAGTLVRETFGIR